MSTHIMYNVTFTTTSAKAHKNNGVTIQPPHVALFVKSHMAIEDEDEFLTSFMSSSSSRLGDGGPLPTLEEYLMAEDEIEIDPEWCLNSAD